jgi:hypothetical protein
MGDGHTAWMWVYKAFIIIWITFGLGYLIMILGFISKGMTSKKVRVVIERRLNTIRSTKDKLSKDITYMRRVVNELYLMKIKPVYEVDEAAEQSAREDFATKRKRTQSSPCVTFGGQRQLSSSLSSLPRGSPRGSPNSRKKSVASLMNRRSSDSDLHNIDKESTFDNAVKNGVTADELLVTVVNALSGDVMLDVMDAVEELNDLEDEAGEQLKAAEGARRRSSTVSLRTAAAFEGVFRNYRDLLYKME